MSLKKITSEEAFEKYVYGNKYVLVDFNAEWCGPCKAMTPHIHKLAKEYSNLVVLDVDIDENPELANNFRIKSVPTFMMFVDGKREKTVVGSSIDAVTNCVNKYVQ